MEERDSQTDRNVQCDLTSARLPISRRRFLQSLGAAAAGLLLAGCRPAQSNETPEAIPTRTPSATPVVANTPAPDVRAAALRNMPNAPIGVARGIYPGRVVWAHNPEATSWNGSTGYWWEDDNLNQDVVSEILSHSLRTLTGQQTDAEAWDALFRHLNATHDRPSQGYRANEKIAIKLNLNAGSAHDQEDNSAFAAPQLVYALLRQLVAVAGVPPDAITAYDVLRWVPGVIYDRCTAGELAGVRFVEWAGGDGREQYARDLECQIRWSSEEIRGNPTYLPTCVTQATYVINLANLKGHNLAGVTLSAKNHFGTLCTDLDGEPTQWAPQGAGIHGTVAAHDYGWGDPAWTWSQRPMGTYCALVDLMGHQHLGEKTLLFILDALYVAHHQSVGIESSSRWQSAPFDGHWTSSLLVSQDGVALDSVGSDFLRAEPTITSLPDVLPPNSTYDNYLHEAALADGPPSGTAYDPEGDGTGLPSLGVHEHWNNPADKQYSRNLGIEEGIELVMAE